MSDNPLRPPRRRLNTAREVCQEYLDRVIAGKSGVGWMNARAEIVKFIAAKGDVLVEDLLCDDLEQFIEDRPTLKSNSTKKRVAQSIKRAFSWAANKNLIGSHPFKGVAYGRGDRGKPMSEAHFRLILRNVSATYRRALLFLWWTGCRPGELCALQWTFIDTEKAVAVLHQHKTAHSTHEPRIICLPEKAVRLLLWIVKQQHAQEEFVFLNQRRGRWHRQHFGSCLHRLRIRLGIPGTVKVYGCRHSFGTRMALAGVELKTLSTLMGHTKSQMSEHYIHLAGETVHLHDALEKALAHKKKVEP